MTKQYFAAFVLAMLSFNGMAESTTDPAKDVAAPEKENTTTAASAPAELTKPFDLNLSTPDEKQESAPEKTATKPKEENASASQKIKVSLREKPIVKKVVKHNFFSPPTLKAVVDLSDQRMRVYINGYHEYTWKVSTARPGYVTPNGTFRPQWLARMHYSKKYDDAPMPYSVFYSDGFAVHGTTSISRLGRPASHGCVRLHPDNARTLFNLVRKHGKSNSRIVVVGSPNYGSSRYASSSGFYGGRRVVERFGFYSRGYDRSDRSRPTNNEYRSSASKPSPSFLDL
jgi:lipoprotein-anchoring transpeptidase ErfK/SrfK